MNTNFDVGDFDFDDDCTEDLVRPPDQSKREILIEDSPSISVFNTFNTFSKYDINLDEEFEKTIQESRNEYDAQQAERDAKVKSLVSIKERLMKVKSYDKANKEIYETIISIIEMYEMEYIDTFSLEVEGYNNIYKIIKTVRLNKDEHKLLEEIIIKNK